MAHARPSELISRTDKLEKRFDGVEPCRLRGSPAQASSARRLAGDAGNRSSISRIWICTVTSCAGSRKGQRRKHHAVDEGEDRRRCPDAQPEHPDYNGGEIPGCGAAPGPRGAHPG